MNFNARYFGIAGIALAAAVVSTSPAKAESLGFSIHDGASGQLTVQVTDDQTGQPISDALIQSTDCSAGHCANITISRAGYATITLLGVIGSNLEISLKPIPAATVTVSGQTAGWRALPASRASQIHAGLVFRTLNIFDLLHFDLTAIVSPLMDSINVIGDHDVPSNLVMPHQSIWTFLGPVTLDKPGYRLPLLAERATRLTALQGEISVSDVTSILQGGKLKPDAVNKLKFTKVGLTAPFQPSASEAISVNADHELVPAHQVTVEQPPFPADVIVAAVTDVEGNRETLLPTDLKTVNRKALARAGTNTIAVKSCASSCGQSQAVITLAFVGQGERICGVVSSPAGASVKPGPYLCTESLPSAKVLPAVISIPTTAGGLSAAVFEAESGTGDQRHSYPVWYVYALPAAGESRIEPASFPARDQIKSYSVMKLEFQNGVDEHALDGRSLMTQLKRFGRSSAHVQ